MCFDFLYNFGVRNFSFYEELSEIWSKNILAFMRSTLNSCPILMKLNVGKGKARPITGHEGPEGEQRYSSVSLTSALDGVGWSTPRLGRITPRKDEVPIV